MQRAGVHLSMTLGAVLVTMPAFADDVSDTFPQPQIRQSSEGVLDTTLRAYVSSNEITDQLTGETRTNSHPDLCRYNSRSDADAQGG